MGLSAMRVRVDSPDMRSNDSRARGLVLAGLVAAAMVGSAGAALVVTATSAPASDPLTVAMASPVPSRGLVYPGLDRGKGRGPCVGGFEAVGRSGTIVGCSHGPDASPVGTDVRRGRSDGQIEADAATIGSTTDTVVGAVGCIADGLAGARVQAVYAVAADRTDRSATVIPAIRASYAPRVDRQLNQSAAETGGEAHIAFATQPGSGGSACQLDVPVVHLTAAGDDSFSNTVDELKAQGFNRSDRKYLVWTDATVLCGIAGVFPDPRPGQENRNNANLAMFARIDAACWNYAEGHELMHSLGAVQWGAPHATPNGHCFDGPDDLCYDDDGTGPVTMVSACPGRDATLFDCNHDDYFYAGAPPAANWLATHWNTWNSRWVVRGPLPGVTPPPPGPKVPQSSTGYWMVAADGHVHPFGGAGFFGQPFPGLGGARAVDLEPTPAGGGYWVLDNTGTVRAYGDATNRGSADPARLGPGERATSLSATPTGAGYWIFTTRGRVLAFGDATFLGDVSSLALNQPVIGSIATPSGRGYYLFAADGGIFSFGDATFRGSTGAIRLNRPVKAMAVAPGGEGYWLVGADGGIFAFGSAGFYGSLGNVALNRPVSAMVPGRHGYLMAGEDGGAFSFGDVDFFGSLGSTPPPSPIVSVALRS